MKIPLDQVEWKTVKFLKTSDAGPVENHVFAYEIELPLPLANWDVWDYWERERFDSMRDNLNYGDILFDIGTEVGWCNLVYAKFVGGDNMVLIEPTPEFWPNIKATWEKNELKSPLACYAGLFSDKTTDSRKTLSVDWPQESGGHLIDKLAYTYIHENKKEVPEITLDDYVGRTGIVPDALTMDVEGAELLILKGAEKTLREHKPKVWVSIHPDLGERDYGVTRDDVLKFMFSLGYRSDFLAKDHEEHWYFS